MALTVSNLLNPAGAPLSNGTRQISYRAKWRLDGLAADAGTAVIANNATLLSQFDFPSTGARAQSVATFRAALTTVYASAAAANQALLQGLLCSVYVTPAPFNAVIPGLGIGTSWLNVQFNIDGGGLAQLEAVCIAAAADHGAIIEMVFHQTSTR